MLTWYVVYKDGTRHDYKEYKFTIANIDKEKIDLLVLHNPSKTEPELIIHFDDPRKRPIYVRRSEISQGKSTRLICHIVGWQMDVGGENIQSLCYVMETRNRKIVKQSNIEGQIVNYEVIEDVAWIENAGKFDRSRNAWFKSPNDVQLNVIGSKAK